MSNLEIITSETPDVILNTDRTIKEYDLLKIERYPDLPFYAFSFNDGFVLPLTLTTKLGIYFGLSSQRIARVINDMDIGVECYTRHVPRFVIPGSGGHAIRLIPPIVVDKILVYVAKTSKVGRALLEKNQPEVEAKYIYGNTSIFPSPSSKNRIYGE
jgi:hypothetical protein